MGQIQGTWTFGPEIEQFLHGGYPGSFYPKRNLFWRNPGLMRSMYLSCENRCRVRRFPSGFAKVYLEILVGGLEMDIGDVLSSIRQLRTRLLVRNRLNQPTTPIWPTPPFRGTSSSACGILGPICLSLSQKGRGHLESAHSEEAGAHGPLR